jgi:hypothetical protein
MLVGRDMSVKLKTILLKEFGPRISWLAFTITIISISLTIGFGARAEFISLYSELDQQAQNNNILVLSRKITILGNSINNQPTEAINVTNLDDFTKIGDIRVNKNNILAIGLADKAYFLSKISASQHAVIETSFAPLSNISNYYIIVEDSFSLIIGDGDRESVMLKSFSPTNTNWDEQIPKNCFISRPPKCFLKSEFPIGQDVIVRVDVDAKIINVNKKKVNLEIKFFDKNGILIDSLTDGPLYWEFTVENKFNDRARYGIGIIDPEARKPKIKFNYLIVKEKLQ